MKTQTLIVLFAALWTVASAQVTTPASSPFAKLEQKVGLTDITVEYSRPSAKGRTVFGELVALDEVWRAGANAATKITFSSDVTLNGTALKAGAYALLITPGATSWKLHFFNYDKSGWGTYIAEGAPAAAAVLTVNTMPLPMYMETWTIGFNDLRNHSATLNLVWANTLVKVDVVVPTDAAVTASIDRTMAGPSANDYYSAASYYLAENKDLSQALTWVNLALEKGGERFWILRTKALIQAGLGDKAGAIATAKRSSTLAQEAGNAEYVRMNDKSISEWMQ